MTKFEKKAAAAVRRELREREDPIMLFDVSCVADQAAFEAGKKLELYRSLYDYGNLLPEGWSQRWLSTDSRSSSDRLLYCCPPGWTSGSSSSQTALLGGGLLVEA